MRLLTLPGAFWKLPRGALCRKAALVPRTLGVHMALHSWPLGCPLRSHTCLPLFAAPWHRRCLYHPPMCCTPRSSIIYHPPFTLYSPPALLHATFRRHRSHPSRLQDKYGFVSTAPGSTIRFKVDTRSIRSQGLVDTGGGAPGAGGKPRPVSVGHHPGQPVESLEGYMAVGPPGQLKFLDRTDQVECTSLPVCARVQHNTPSAQAFWSLVKQ